MSRMVTHSVEKDAQLYRQIVEYSFDTTVIHSKNKVLYINDTGVDFFGAENKEDLIQASVVDIFTEEYREFIKERIRKGEEEGQIGELVETRVRRVDGQIADVELICRPVMYGETPAIQSVMRDITQQKEAEREMIEMMTPIVPLTKSVSIIPLVGSIDEYRSIQLLESLPARLQRTELENVIIDVSGIYNINEFVLDFLYKIHSTLLLSGITPVMTGIRAELASKLVQMRGTGNLAKMVTMGDVEQALKYLHKNENHG